LLFCVEKLHQLTGTDFLPDYSIASFKAYQAADATVTSLTSLLNIGYGMDG